MTNRHTIRLAALVAALLVLLAPSVALAQTTPQLTDLVAAWGNWPLFVGVLVSLAIEAWRQAKPQLFDRLSPIARRLVPLLVAGLGAGSLALIGGADWTMAGLAMLSAWGMALATGDTLRVLLDYVFPAKPPSDPSAPAVVTESDLPPSPKPPILPAAIVLAVACSFTIPACHPQSGPRDTAALVQQSAAVAYGLSVEALVTTDTVLEAYLRGLDDPTQADLDRVQPAVHGLVKAREALLKAREALVAGESAIEDMRAALPYLSAAVAGLESAGIDVPESVTSTLETIGVVLQ